MVKFVKEFWHGLRSFHNSIAACFGAVAAILSWLLPKFDLGDKVNAIMATISLPYRLLIFFSGLFISTILTSYSLYKKQEEKIKEQRQKINNFQHPIYEQYKQPLAIGTADVQWTAESDKTATYQLLMGYLTLEKGGDVLLKMNSVNGTKSKHIANNLRSYKASFELDTTDKSIDKPINYLAKADFARIYLEHLTMMIPDKNKISGGAVIFTFNSSVRIEIPIPQQLIDNNTIIIQDIHKYFK